MDKERYERENREAKLKEIYEKLNIDPQNLPQNINYRLLQEYEVPEWIRFASSEQKEELKEYGKGMRSKQRINYRDDVDESDNIEEDSDCELNKKRRRSRQPKDESNLQSNKKRKLNEEEEVSQSLNSHINLEDDEYAEVSKSYSTQNNKPSNSKMRIKLNSGSNLRIGILLILL